MFAWLIENTVTLVVWTLVAALACRAAKRRPVLQHVLWTLVMVKLLLPPLVAAPRTLVDSLPLAAIDTVQDALAASPDSLAERLSHGQQFAQESGTFGLGREADEPGRASVAPAVAPTTATSRRATPESRLQFYPEWATVSLAWFARRWRESLVVVWLLAAAAVWARQAWSVVCFQMRVRSGEPPPIWLDEIVKDVARRLAIRPPAVQISGGIGSPLIWCCGRPRLLWPRELAHGLNLPWQAIVTHELAHVKRRDHWVGWLELAATGLWWWHPAFWYVRRELHASADLACDAWALAISGEPGRTYAAGLVDVAQGCSPPCAAPALALGWGAGRTFQRRLTMILGNRISPALPRGGKLAALLFAVLLVPTWSQDRADQSVRPARGPSSELSSPETTEDEDQPAEATSRPYAIGPADVLKIFVDQAVPVGPRRIGRLESVQIRVNGALPDQPLDGRFDVDEEGTIDLGPSYGRVKIAGLTRAEAQQTMVEYLRQMLRDPEVSLSLTPPTIPSGIQGEHLVGPDGRISVGDGDTVLVAGLTIAQAHEKLVDRLRSKYEDISVSVEVSQFNSQAVYMIVETPQGDRIHRQPYTGSGTIIDALSRIADLRLSKGTEIVVQRMFLKEDNREKEDRVVEIQLFWGDKFAERMRQEKLRPSDRIFVKRPRDER